MAKQTINQGTAPTGAGGDTFRSGSAKLQANDDEIYSQLGATAQGVLPAALPVNKGGTGASTAAAARTNLGLGSAATANLTTSATDSTAGRVMKVGDFGVGSIAPPFLNLSESDTSLPTGFYVFPPGSVFPATQVCSLSYNPSYSVQFAFVNQGGNPILKARRYGVGNWGGMTTYYCDKNTTVDGNGFIKAASPIVKLFADRVELNDEAEQQDIVFEKLSAGDYLIKGSSGFAQEGWYVETPKDANGNVLFSVVYTTLKNGDISVKTYKKKFDFETVSIVADLDNPVDITENRWIDLRLQELPQPEIEIPEPIAPPDFQPTGLAEAVATVMESYNDPEQ